MYDWNNVDNEFLTFTRHLIALRAAHPVFRRRRWFSGEPMNGCEIDDMIWFTPEGSEMTENDWAVGHARSLAVFLKRRGHHFPQFARSAVD